jgi:hypothetical protein
MNSYLNHFCCPFFSEHLDKCQFNQKKVKKNMEYQAQCCDRNLDEMIEEERRNIYKERTLKMLRELPPSYITHQRITAIETILNENT